MGAFALASALFQRERACRGQHIDLAMLDVAMILMSSCLTNGCFAAKEGLAMLGTRNLPQQRQLWQALERPEMAKRTSEEREHNRDSEAALLANILKTRTTVEWEVFLQARHVPAARVRSLAEAVHDPQFAGRGITYGHPAAPGVEGSFSVPLAAFRFAICAFSSGA
jgi:crotonobetainyl-CoA:carnitine CoA-transferase CaiB-like acyl-CoA transferase